VATPSGPPPTAPDIPRPALSRGARGIAALRSRPILCLALLTPGLPEYLSTSSALLYLVTNPAFFLLQLAINVGQYTAGALLVREAMLRWKKGWATVFLLAAAYGVTEECLGDNTLFNSTHGNDGILGSFGRFAGVNWVWATGVLLFHVIYSIGLPILLLRLAVPATTGRSLVGRRGLVVALGSLAVATGTETAIVYGSFHFWMGPYLLLGALAVIALLVLLAYVVPRDFWRPATVQPRASPTEVVAIGFAFFPVAFLFEYGFAGTGVPAAAVILAELLTLTLLAETVRRRIGRTGHDYLLVNLALGFVLWQALFGVLLTLGLPYTLPLVALVGLFFWRLRRSYAPDTLRAAPELRPPAGALGCS
jgi:hypothetical protein